jgi:hypothetical protein
MTYGDLSGRAGISSQKDEVSDMVDEITNFMRDLDYFDDSWEWVPNEPPQHYRNLTDRLEERTRRLEAAQQKDPEWDKAVEAAGSLGVTDASAFDLKTSDRHRYEKHKGGRKYVR